MADGFFSIFVTLQQFMTEQPRNARPTDVWLASFRLPFMYLILNYEEIRSPGIVVILPINIHLLPLCFPLEKHAASIKLFSDSHIMQPRFKGCFVSSNVSSISNQHTGYGSLGISPSISLIPSISPRSKHIAFSDFSRTSSKAFCIADMSTSSKEKRIFSCRIS